VPVPSKTSLSSSNNNSNNNSNNINRADRTLNILVKPEPILLNLNLLTRVNNIMGNSRVEHGEVPVDNIINSSNNNNTITTIIITTTSIITITSNIDLRGKTMPVSRDINMRGNIPVG